MLSLTNLPSPEAKVLNWDIDLLSYNYLECVSVSRVLVEVLWGLFLPRGMSVQAERMAGQRAFTLHSFFLPAKIRLLQLQTALVSHQRQHDGNTDGLSGWGQPIGIPCLSFAECLARAYAVFSKLYCQCVCAGNCSSSLKVLFFISKTEVYQK